MDETSGSRYLSDLILCHYLLNSSRIGPVKHLFIPAFSIRKLMMRKPVLKNFLQQTETLMLADTATNKHHSVTSNKHFID